MKRRQRNTVFIVCVIGLFISSSIVPAFSVDFRNKITDIIEDNVESFIESKINETDYLENIGYYDVIDPDPGYDINRMRMEEDYKERLRERYSDGYLMNHSDYPFDDYERYNEYHERIVEEHEELMQQYHKQAKPQTSEPTEKPDFENGKTWYVDDVPGKGPDNPPEDFTKIQDAINASNDGDKVVVYSGFYQENLIVNKSIILQGEDKNSTIIDGSKKGDVIYVFVDWIIIQDFKIQNGTAGILLSDSSGNTITGNNITDNTWDGIGLSDSSGNTITGNNITDNTRDGIGLSYSSGNTITGNNITDNTRDGIKISDSSNNLIMNNYLIKNLNGILLDHDSFNNSFYKNHCNSNKVNGIAIRVSAKNSISYNFCERNQYGILLINSDNNTIRENILSSNNCGIELRDSYFNRIKNCTIAYNNFNGIYSYGSCM